MAAKARVVPDTVAVVGHTPLADVLIGLVGVLGLRCRRVPDVEAELPDEVAALILPFSRGDDPTALDITEADVRVPLIIAAAQPTHATRCPVVNAPFKAVDLAAVLRVHTRLSIADNETIIRARTALNAFVGHSPALRRVIDRLPRVARSSASVLICGETGTGKELCARALHYLGQRAHGPFIPINCGALPPDVADNELFGHVPGAFTDARQTQSGMLEQADGGTIFLDEVDSLAPLVQVKLLRFLQEGEYRHLGSPDIRKADVRVVAATNMTDGKAERLRADLYYRLSTVTIEIPPLRERVDDIPELATHFLRRFTPKAGPSKASTPSRRACPWSPLRWARWPRSRSSYGGAPRRPSSTS
ncbi:MAG: sigma-54-dependent Fis family transcriptional regulator, partial [Deltaproteobacteria bacterium]|nr:sigma-54-dependent Fis family transcriptional regulator [Deltaproteobacteria bacterium]